LTCDILLYCNCPYLFSRPIYSSSTGRLPPQESSRAGCNARCTRQYHKAPRPLHASMQSQSTATDALIIFDWVLIPAHLSPCGPALYWPLRLGMGHRSLSLVSPSTGVCQRDKAVPPLRVVQALLPLHISAQSDHRIRCLIISPSSGDFERGTPMI
jgi:hypothetical protein